MTKATFKIERIDAVVQKYMKYKEIYDNPSIIFDLDNAQLIPMPYQPEDMPYLYKIATHGKLEEVNTKDRTDDIKSDGTYLGKQCELTDKNIENLKLALWISFEYKDGEFIVTQAPDPKGGCIERAKALPL